MSDLGRCSVPPEGWWCSRQPGHEGPCATRPVGEGNDAQVRVSELVAPREYRGWSISWDYGYFTATGPNYDASYEGPEDGLVDNGETCSARTWPDLKEEIDAHIEERGQ